MNAQQLSQFAEQTYYSMEAVWPAQITFDGSDTPIQCAGGLNTFSKNDLQLGGVLAEFDVVFRILKSRLPTMPALGSKFTYDDTEYRVAKVVPNSGPYWIVAGMNPAK